MPVRADFATGASAYLAGDYATALSEWKPLAEQGDARVQAILGLMYIRDDGVPQDDAEAVKWYRLAQLQQLLDEDAISVDEYNAKKQEILDEL